MEQVDSVNNTEVVLIVEDSRAIAVELQRKIDEHTEFRAEIVGTCEAAVEFARQHRNEIFLAILDLNLPDSGDGGIVDVFCELEIPSIVFTADLDETTRRLMLTKDIIDYVVKDTRSIDTILRYIERLDLNRRIGVLVVDDSDSLRSVLSRMLGKLMFCVLEAPDAETALKMINSGADIRLAIVDYEMPGMNGVELVRRIRERFSREELGVIGLSSSGEPLLTAKFIKNGANDFIIKPFEAEAFYCRVRSTLENLELISRLKEANTVKNQFLGMAAHDLRSPISGINGFTQLLLDNLCGDLTEEQRDIIEVINVANWQMNEMVNDLLDISAIESGQLKLKKEKAYLRELVESRLRIHCISARNKAITFRTDLQEVGPIWFDVRRMGQVIDNLLTNALKFSPAGSFVDLSLAGEGGEVEFCVRDYGQGVPPEEKSLLFQTFKKTRVRPTAGETSTGLGLHIVKKIVEAHGGRVWVDSVFGKGASFYFSLPSAG
ncbi:hybrid sensor histidine kinase/response regulator [Maridesulfovibrio sp. FT414]|uniref:hybrid sensor histidine kinase/response regulator n=1 Tax=Maridesulfovibrio sp. FT414 TaxID=2979469 RepID=UPI003D809596